MKTQTRTSDSTNLLTFIMSLLLDSFIFYGRFRGEALRKPKFRGNCTKYYPKYIYITLETKNIQI